MTVNSISTPTPTPTATTGSSALDQLASDKTMFLNLLTTQMQNQDPLNPMDTSQYTQQLTQFSQVEQSIQQNSTLNSILSALSGQNLFSAAATVGQTATFDSDVAGLTATAPASWHYAATHPASAMVATISDAKGNAVAKATLNAQSGTFQWDGTLADGSKAQPGSYSLSVAALDATGADVPVTVQTQGTIGQVTSASGATQFVVNGATLPASSLVGLGVAG
ncbi:MAG: flagellar hook assembly protein FlgD [Sphingomonas sp.]